MVSRLTTEVRRTTLSYGEEPLVRVLDTGDLSSVLDIDECHRKSSHSPLGASWSKAQWLQELNKGSGLGFFSGQNLLGFVLGYSTINEFEITQVQTSPQYLKQGVMSALFTELFTTYPRTSFFLEVHENNMRALKFYYKRGFEPVGERAKYYSDGSACKVLRYSSKI